MNILIAIGLLAYILGVAGGLSAFYDDGRKIADNAGMRCFMCVWPFVVVILLVLGILLSIAFAGAVALMLVKCGVQAAFGKAPIVRAFTLGIKAKEGE